MNSRLTKMAQCKAERRRLGEKCMADTIYCLFSSYSCRDNSKTKRNVQKREHIAKHIERILEQTYLV